MKPEDYIIYEEKYGTHDYHPLLIVLRKGEDMFVWDMERKRYPGFLSGYLVLSQGHCRLEIVEALTEQAERLTLVSRAFHTDILGEYMEFTCKFFNYDKLLPINTRAEMVETALKLCRRWGHRRKGVTPEHTKIVIYNEDFHGRTITIIPMSTSPSSYTDLSPYTLGFIEIPYSNVDALVEALKDPDTIDFLVKPIQGKVEIVMPGSDYLRACCDPCHQKSMLFITDRIQTGIGRTGELLACDYEGIRPDILILGKMLSGGVSSVSTVLVDDEVMLTIVPGEHGPTYGGNPLAAEAAITTLEVVHDEHLSESAFKMGELFRGEMGRVNNPVVREVRGKGLLSTVVTEPKDGKTVWDICLALKENNLIARSTHDHIIYLIPPLVIAERQMMEAVNIIRDTFAKF